VRRALLGFFLLGVFLLATLGVYLLSDGGRRRDSVEAARIFYDTLTCESIIADAAPDAPSADPAASAASSQEQEAHASIYPGPEDCRGKRDRSLRQPRIYVAWRETERALGCGSERQWRDWLLANDTATLVATPEQAEFVWIPFPESCSGCSAYPGGDPRSCFARVFAAVKHLGPGRFATFCSRPWMERTLYAMDMREFLQQYSQVWLFSPEIKNVRMAEMRRAPSSFRRHIVVPQWPGDFQVYHANAGSSRSVAAGGSAATPAPVARRYMFCFQGTQVNDQRTATAKVLAQRGDSYVRAMCRRHRTESQTDMNTRVSTELYSQCEFCPLPKGDSLSDRRYFDAMRTGCLPVVFERLRPLPFANWLDYFSWALLQLAHDEASLAASFNRLAAMPLAERDALREAMLHTARQMSFSACQDRAGLVYAMASLVALPEDHPMDDLWGYAFEVA
jgi:hypothetical protein